MAAPYEGPLRLCDVEGAAQLLSAEWPKQSAESRAKQAEPRLRIGVNAVE